MGALYRARRRVARRTGRLRLEAWARQADAELRAHGSRLVLDLDGDVHFETLPRLQVTPQGLTAPVSGAPPQLTLRLGKDAYLGADLVLEVRPNGHNTLEVGARSSFLSHTRVTLFDGTVRLGSEAQMRAFSMLKSSGELTIGDRTIISHQSIVHCASRIDIGKGVTLAERVSVLDSDHDLDGSDVNPMDRPIRISPVVIGRNAFIGANSVVLRGAQIGTASLVGAGAVVLAGDYPDGWLVAGTPARALRPLGGVPAPER